MYAHGTGKLCYAGYRTLNVLSCCHDKVSKLVNDDDDVRHELVTVSGVELMVKIFLIILFYVSRSRIFKQAVTVVHERAETVEGLYNLRRVCNDWLIHIFV